MMHNNHWSGMDLFPGQRTWGDLRLDDKGEAEGVPFREERGFLSGDFMGLGILLLYRAGEFLAELLRSCSFSSSSRTSDIFGRDLGSRLRHRRASEATVKAAFWGYWPSNLVSIIRNNFRRSPKYGFAQSTRLCSMPTFDLSIARRPVSSSSKTTP